MTQPDPIVLDVDASGYIANLQRAENATTGFTGVLRGVPMQIGPMQRAMDSLTPKRATLLGMGALAATAGNTQAQLAQVQAQAKITGQNFGTMSEGMRNVARDLPITNAGSRQLYGTLTRLGVATGGMDKPLNAVDKSFGRLNKTWASNVPVLNKLSKAAEDTFGARGSLFGGGTEKKVERLAGTFAKLGAATGENSSQLASGMIRLNQAMGSGTGADRVDKLSDSLTTVSAKTGASATGILEFSRAIAPMARAAGLGQTQVMGVSAAFSAMGEDGYAAANAFTKMTSDLSRSVREGSPLMSNYAQIVGKTTTEFEALFKLNPAEAITQVTEAIGAAGDEGPRLLEQLGLDGVRTQRAIQGLSATGGLRSAIATSVGAYGNGSTEEASKEAFDGLFDSTQRAAAASEQLAVALGSPLLSPLTVVTNALGAMAAGLEKLLGGGMAQSLLSTAAWAGAAAIVAKSVIGKALVASGVGQLLSSGPVRGAAAGAMMGLYRGDADRVRGSWVGRNLGVGRFVDRVQRQQPVGSERMAGFNMRMYDRFSNLLTRFGPDMTRTGGGGPSMLRQAGAFGGMGLGMYMRLQADQMRQTRLPFEQRQGVVRPYGNAQTAPMYQRFAENRLNLQSQLQNRVITRGDYFTALRKEFDALNKSVAGVQGPLRSFGQNLVRGGAALATQTAITGARVGAGAAMRAGGALAGAVGGPVGLALTGGMVAYGMRQASQRANDQELEGLKSTSFIDDYRIAMGKATEATSTFAGALESEAKSRLGATFEEAQAFDEEDKKAAAMGGQKSKVRDYKGMSRDQVVALLELQAQTTGITGDDLNRIQQDLTLSGFSDRDIEAISGRVPDGTGGGTGLANTEASIKALQEQVTGIADMEGIGWNKAKKWLNLFDLGGIRGLDAGAYKTVDTRSDAQKQQSTDVVKGITERSGERASVYGADYAADAERKEIDAAIEAAITARDYDTMESLVEKYQKATGLKAIELSANDITGAGGFTAAQAAQDRDYREGVFSRAETGAKIETPRLAESWVTKEAGTNPLAQWFSVNSNSSVSNILDQLQNGGAEDPSVQTAAQQQAVAAARASGQSMTELSKNITLLANDMREAGGAARTFALELRNTARQQVALENQSRSGPAAMMVNAGMAADDIAVNPLSQDAKAIREGGISDLMGLRDQLTQQAKARATALRESIVQRTRMAEDYRRQDLWGEQAYERSMERAGEDYSRTRVRAQLQFDTSMKHMRTDYRRSQLIAERDFNKQMRRAAEDGARGLYDAYQRIQVQPIWDAANLQLNLEDQNAAINEQIKNLDRLRRAGGSEDMIKLLGLNDPKNAQQLAEIVASMAESPEVVAALNKAAADRQRLGGVLVNDKANTALQRAREDYAQSVRDAAEQFDIMVRRATEAFQLGSSQMAEDNKRMLDRASQDRATSLSQMQAQYATSVNRMREDIRRADEEITGDLASLSKILSKGVNAQMSDFEGQTTNTLDGIILALEGFVTKWDAMLRNLSPIPVPVVPNSAPMPGAPGFIGPTAGASGAVAPGSMPSAGAGTSRSNPGGTAGGAGPTARITRGGGVSDAYGTGARGTTITTGKPKDVLAAYDGKVRHVGKFGQYGLTITLDHGMDRATRYGYLSDADVRVGQRVARGKDMGETSGKLFFEALQNGRPIDPAKAEKQWKYFGPTKGFAVGGRVAGPGTGTSDSINARLSNGEFVFRADTSKAIGYADLDRLNKAGSQASLAMLDGLKTAGGSTKIVYDSSTHLTDHSTRFTGDITVQAQDPNAMANALRQKTRSANLTAPATRRSS